MPALTLCAFQEHSLNLYVPERYLPGHMLERVLGESAFLRLIANYGGETVTIPRVRLDKVRRLGHIYRMTRRGLQIEQIAQELGITPQRVNQVQADLAGAAPLTHLARIRNQAVIP